MNRRQIITAGAASVLAAPSKTEAGAIETPVSLIYREFRSIFELVESGSSTSTDDEIEVLIERAYNLADEIIDIPSEGPMDLIFKLMAYTMDGTTDPLMGDLGHKIYSEARALIRRDNLSS